MNLWQRLFPAPSIEDSARHMAEWNALGTRERIKARARLMRAEMGLPEAKALR